MTHKRKRPLDKENHRKRSRMAEEESDKYGNKIEEEEKPGVARRLRVQETESSDSFRLVVEHHKPVTAVALSNDDFKGFSASKDGAIIHWDVEYGAIGNYLWPSKEMVTAHGAKNLTLRSTKWSKHILDICVSSDGRYLATGGRDCHVHLWDTRTRQHIRALPGHIKPVSSLSFGQGSSRIVSGSFDGSLKLWKVDDGACVDTIAASRNTRFNTEILSIDVLREKVLFVTRDRTMCLWKAPRPRVSIIFQDSSFLESCCFVGNYEYLAGAYDGSIRFWEVNKYPFIVKNAHAATSIEDDSNGKDDGVLSAKDLGHISTRPSHCSSALSWVGAVAVCRNSDLAASGAGNGVVRLWTLKSNPKKVKSLYKLPLDGFVNSLVFAKSRQFLVAGVGQEPRLGQWGCLPASRNGVFIHPLNIIDEDQYDQQQVAERETLCDRLFSGDRCIFKIAPYKKHHAKIYADMKKRFGKKQFGKEPERGQQFGEEPEPGKEPERGQQFGKEPEPGQQFGKEPERDNKRKIKPSRSREFWGATYCKTGPSSFMFL